MDIVIDPTQYDEAEIEEGVADLLELVAEAVEEGHDAGQLIVIIGIALRMLIEEYGDYRQLH
jgi:predicted secreted protein